MSTEHPAIISRRQFLLTAALAGAGALCPWSSALSQEASEAAKPSFPWEGEELYYKAKIRGSEAAQAVLRLGQLRLLKGKTPYVPLSVTIKSVGLFHSVYPMHDRADTFIHAETLQPLRSEKIIQEAGKERIYKVDYKVSEYAAHVEQIRDKKPRTYITAVPNTIHDAFTWFLHLRRRTDLAQGARFDYYVYDGWKLSRVGLHVIGEERVLTPMGWFKAWKMEIEREVLRSAFDMAKPREGERAEEKPPILKTLTPGEHVGWIWLSQDEHRLPVKIYMEAPIGSGEILLARHVEAK
jgi:hypothetical protein